MYLVFRWCLLFMARAKRASIVFKVENVKDSPSLKGWQNFRRKFWRGSLEKWKEKLPVYYSHDWSIVWAHFYFVGTCLWRVRNWWWKNKNCECVKRVWKWKNTETCASENFQLQAYNFQLKKLTLHSLKIFCNDN